MNLDEALGIDYEKPIQRQARDLVEADETFLDDLVAIRESQKLSQKELGDRMGISQSAVARIESRERDPRLSTLRRYALAVGATYEHQVRRFDLTGRVRLEDGVTIQTATYTLVVDNLNAMVKARLEHV